MKFVFSDGEKLGVYDDGKIQKFESTYITHYRETATKSAKNKEWKTQGHAAQMMSEGYYWNEREESVTAAIHGEALNVEDYKLVYDF